MTRVLVFGTFDGLHKGHLDFFLQAKKTGDPPSHKASEGQAFLIAVVARDSTVKKLKNKKPKNNEQKRLTEVRNCEYVNEVLLGQEKHDPRSDSYDIIKEINPDVVCLGYDQAIFLNKLKSELKRMNLSPKIKVLKPYKPQIYHSSLINSIINNNHNDNNNKQ